MTDPCNPDSDGYVAGEDCADGFLRTRSAFDNCSAEHEQATRRETFIETVSRLWSIGDRTEPGGDSACR